MALETNLNPSGKQSTQTHKRKEKDQRRKQYDDQQVQGTNNSSIVSKRSVEKLYFPQIQPELGSWFSHFVPSSKKDRRSPAINRGYWIRMESIRQTLYRIIGSQWCSGEVEGLVGNENDEMKMEKKKKKRRVVNVINLGCGFDPLPFQMMSMRNKGLLWGADDIEVNFIDVDYPDLVEEKYLLIKASDEIKQLIGTEVDRDDPLCKLNTANYRLIGCDLKNLKQYQDIVDHYLLTKDASESEYEMNVFIAEVSLAYMKPEFANPVIEISSKTCNSNFIILEQIMPDGASNSFATKMLYHFAHLRSPIQCVESYPTKSQQLQRFQQYYNFSEVRNLFENWQSLIEDDEIKHQMMQVEEFDEWEEFILFCQHYIVLHATNDVKQLVYDEKLQPDFQVDDGEGKAQFAVDDEVKLSIDERFDDKVDMLQVKFPACARLNDKVYVQGGLKQTRTNETIEVDYDTGEIRRQFSGESGDDNVPPPRMCHCLTTVSDSLILTGGRTRPGDVKDDIYKNDRQNWLKIGHLDEPRSRHSAVAINDKEILIFGGLLETSNGDPFILYNVATNQIQPLQARGDYIDNLYSSTIVYHKNDEGYIYGGFNQCHLPSVNDRLYKFVIDYDTNQIKLEVVLQHFMFARIGSQAQLISNNHSNKLLIVGGVSSETILTRMTNIVTLQLDTLTFNSVEISSAVSLRYPPIFIGFGLVSMNQHLSLIIGGGAVCYSFGSCYNCVYKLEY
ncbi:hypothetical protein CANMA_004566 [Candida margitis]|uniref:PPM2 n=1 Tax=Candida margitis TaxID=1775924 RepID=UPI0022260B4D|nr:PPM2 [Candida margitis]XP_051669873.1 uncharacterized protein CANMA_004566 [Candida margitis]KAI5956119.1 PPM2 [Candida margitis]KAI5956137.1 hypothetical protein CANMA_004566 [Candida margitis]